MPDDLATRRRFLETLAAGLGIANLGCGRPPPDRIVARVESHPELVPGVPIDYATALVHDGLATGVVVRCREGRPLKIEGNPAHPASLGATTAIDQASILELYDPRRTGALAEAGALRSWTALGSVLARAGRRVRLWLPPTSSPTRAELLARIAARNPALRVVLSDPRTPDRGAIGRRLFGRALLPDHDLRGVDRVLVLDGDPFGSGPAQLGLARQLADRRRLRAPTDEVARLYSCGPRPSCTSTLADRHLPCRGCDVAAIALGLVRAVADARAATRFAGAAPELSPDAARFVATVARELLAARGRTAVLVGEAQPWPVHALARLLDDLLHSSATRWRESPLVELDAQIGPGELVEEIAQGEVDLLVVADVDVVGHGALTPELLARVPSSVAWSRYDDATARACRWVVPAAHDLEGWSDARAHDGTITILQPLVRPIRQGRTLDELLARFDVEADAEQLVRNTWATRWGSGWAARWDDALRRGLVPDSALPEIATRLASDTADAAIAAIAGAAPCAGLELVTFVDGKIDGGRAVANPWLQELPDPITKQTWGNAAWIAPALADAHGLTRGDIVRVSTASASIELPIVIVPEQAEGTIAIAIGYGQPHACFEDFPVPGPWSAPSGPIGVSTTPLASGCGHRDGIAIARTERCEAIAITQDHMDQRGRELALATTFGELRRRGAELTAHLRGDKPRLGLVDRPRESPQWGMVVDLSACSGCSACVIACQAENNIATVGPVDVGKGRELHWLRIDRYYEGTRAVVQPMLCQHCEYAPCEYVCPVNATVHSPDGLNEMVYNRCVGTRFCSNNCPYHVRRFNWFDYSRKDELALQKNPEVTVRERGVMEKCTYCVQRIRRAGLAAELADRSLRDGDVVTACQQVCPTGAIAFGDISDPDSEVSQWRRRAHRYEVLHELGTRPRTLYLAQVRDRGDEEVG